MEAEDELKVKNAMIEEKEAQILQQQQIYNPNNQKPFMNTKRRSGAAEMQIRDGGIGAAS